jgi:serine/threonine protein kinase
MNKNDGKYYAVKVIRETNNADNNIKAVLAEAKILKELNHPNILHLYEIDANGTYEKADGTTKK